MKIAFPVHHFPPRYSAGGELYTFRLARWFQQHDHDVEIICVESINSGAPDRIETMADRYEGIPVQRLSFDLFGAGRPRWRYDNPLLTKWFADYIERARPDLFHFQAGYLLGVTPLEVAVRAGIPTLLTLHDYWFLCPRITLQRGDGSLCDSIPEDPAGCAWCMRLESRRYRLPDRLLGGRLGDVARRFALNDNRVFYADRRARLLQALALPDLVIAPSHFLAGLFEAHVQPDKLRYIRYGMDAAAFKARRAPGAPGSALRFGFIGQIAPHKGVHLLVKAFQVLRPKDRPIELHIYGNLDAQPEYVRHLRRMASATPSIHFNGSFENGRLAEVLSGMDVSVTPSIWYENSPLAIHEAHAAGLPVITAELGGMAELVRDGIDGLHFRPDDAADLACKMQQIIDQPELLPRLRAGVLLPRTLDEEMEQLSGIYHRLVEQKRSETSSRRFTTD